jgi:hypothetical protein
MNNGGELDAVGRVSGLIKQACCMIGSLLAVALTWAGLSSASAQRPPADRSPRREMISLVVLSNSCVDLDVRSLSKALDEIYPGKFVPLEQQANFVVSGSNPGQFLVKSTIPGAKGMFMVLSVPAPYTEFSDFARFITDASLRRKAEAQQCWLSIDLIHMFANKDEAYRFIAVALAKLAPADAAVLVKPETNAAILFTPELRSQLAAGQPP